MIPTVSPAGSPAIVTGYPNSTGVGQSNVRLLDLGLYSQVFFRRIHRRWTELASLELCYTSVGPRFLPSEFAYGLSILGLSRWEKVMRRYSLVHVTSPEFFHIAKRRRGVIGTVHDLYHLDSRLAKGFSRLSILALKEELAALRRLEGVIAISNSTRDRLVQLCPDLDVRTIHNWTPDVFHPRDKADARARLGLPQDKRILLSVSSSSPNKNLRLLGDIASGVGDGAMILHIGEIGGSDPRELPGVVQLSGWTPAELLPLYYNAADLYLATSTAEGFSFPIIEAVNSGLPVVAPRIDVFVEVLRNSPYLVDSWDSSVWVERTLKLLESTELSRATVWYKNGFGDYYRRGRALEEMHDFLAKFGGATRIGE